MTEVETAGEGGGGGEYSITLDVSGNYIFPSATVGYATAPAAQTVTVTNTGNQATGALTVALGGASPSSFILNASSISSIAVSGTAAFTVVPNTDLAVGTYTATVTVSGDHGITASFTVSFTVSAAYTISIGSYAHGTVTADPSPAAAVGTTVTLTVTPDSGYTLKSGTLKVTQTDNTELTLSGSGPYTFAMPSDNVTVSAVFVPPTATQATHTVGGVSFMLRYVPAGSFQRDVTAANVSIITEGYWMGETEVTQELFDEVMGYNPSYFDGSAGKTPEVLENQDKRPVENVNWYHAIAFCNKLSILEGKTPVYSVTESAEEVDWENLAYGAIPTSNNSNWNAVIADWSVDGYRLPTEMEWMWAAMGADLENSGEPNISGYAKGYAGSTEVANSQNNISNYAWWNGNAVSKTHETGKKTVNGGLGLFDMSGNVIEWCWDWFGNTLPNGTLNNYKGPNVPSVPAYRVCRGGGYGSESGYYKIVSRDTYDSVAQENTIGFRVVCKN
jgi:formylglycine-generating enzyme required for sulfatase activity